MDDNQCWGQLVSLTEFISEPFLLKNDTIVLGRAKDADICLPSNVYMSNKHCFVYRDKDGIVWLEDCSTNGTFLNKDHKVHKQKVRLEHGDEFYPVFRKKDPQLNVGYIYQDMIKLQQERSSSSEATLEYTLDQTSGSDEDVSRKRPNETAEPLQSPLKKICQSAVASSTTACNAVADANCQVMACVPAEESTVSTIENAESQHVLCQQVAGASDNASGKAISDSDAFEEHLICMICQEVLYNCISLQPCLHSFCAGCYSDWMVQSDSCPSCRHKVTYISKNHLVNNLVQAYLKEHPDKQRSEDDLKLLDSKNKITADMLKQPKKLRHDLGSDSDEHSDTNELSSSDSESGSHQNLGNAVPNVFLGNPILGNAYRVPMFGFTSPFSIAPPMTCRQCPNATSNTSATGGASVAPLYVCRPYATHLLCHCCNMPMPDRRTDRNHDATLPAQQCGICARYFCHMYWGCQKANCLGCLNQLKDMKFGNHCLDNIILSNQYESNILKKYLESQRLSVDDLLATCCQKLNSGEYKLIGQFTSITTYSIVCYTCGLQVFRELAYLYRSALSLADLPAEASGRVDCYWGKNCRTQGCKPQHAAKFNHICEQTRRN